MEDLKRKIKEIVPENKLEEVDKIFSDWIASLKVHTIPEHAEETEEKGSDEKRHQKDIEKVPLKSQVEGLKKQIGSFKEKMKAYKASTSSTTDLALADVKEEIAKVREEISKLKLKFSSQEDESKRSENAELIQKLDEVKTFLEKLK